jgi:hypothetical protein
MKIFLARSGVSKGNAVSVIAARSSEVISLLDKKLDPV